MDRAASKPLSSESSVPVPAGFNPRFFSMISNVGNSIIGKLKSKHNESPIFVMVVRAPPASQEARTWKVEGDNV